MWTRGARKRATLSGRRHVTRRRRPRCRTVCGTGPRPTGWKIQLHIYAWTPKPARRPRLALIYSCRRAAVPLAAAWPPPPPLLPPPPLPPPQPAATATPICSNGSGNGNATRPRPRSGPMMPPRATYTTGLVFAWLCRQADHRHHHRQRHHCHQHRRHRLLLRARRSM